MKEKINMRTNWKLTAKKKRSFEKHEQKRLSFCMAAEMLLRFFQLYQSLPGFTEDKKKDIQERFIVKYNNGLYPKLKKVLGECSLSQLKTWQKHFK